LRLEEYIPIVEIKCNHAKKKACSRIIREELAMDQEKSLEMIYNALRDETLMMFEMQEKTISFTWTIAAALLGVAVVHPTTPSGALIYPPIATLLALSWIQRSYSIRDLGNYMITLENKVPFTGWEEYLKSKGGISKLSFNYLSNFGLSIFIQIVAIVTGIYNFDLNKFNYCCLNPLEKFLIFFDICCVLITFISMSEVYYRECFADR
jgi:hypothetical protein